MCEAWQSIALRGMQVDMPHMPCTYAPEAQEIIMPKPHLQESMKLSKARRWIYATQAMHTGALKKFGEKASPLSIALLYSTHAAHRHVMLEK